MGQMLWPFVGQMVRALHLAGTLFGTEGAEAEMLFLHSLGTDPVHMSGQPGGGGCTLLGYDIFFHVLHDSKVQGETVGTYFD